MKKPDFLDELAEKLCNALPSSVKNMKDDLQKNIRTVLLGAFAKLEIVTREEFDAQTKVLARTRKKLDALEKQLNELCKTKL